MKYVGETKFGEVPWLTLVGTVVAVVLYAVPGASQMFAYDTHAAHSWIHTLTSHWVHWNGEHLFWSVAAFLLIGVLCEMRDRRSFVTCVAACAFVVPVSVRLGAPHLTSYAGLSGIDFGLYTLFCVQLIRQNVGLLRWAYVSAAGLLLAAAIAKAAYELLTGTVLFVSASTAMAPAPVAHLTAACVGIVVGLRTNTAVHGLTVNDSASRETGST